MIFQTKVILTILLSFLCILGYSQKNKKELRLINESDSIANFIDSKIDSATNVIKTSSDLNIKKVDSTFKAMYLNVLERTSNIQNNRDTYYSFIIAAFTFLIAVVAIAAGINWYQATRRSKKDLRDQAKQFRKILESEKDLFEKTVREQKDSFNELALKFNSLRDQNEKAIKNLVEEAEQQIKQIESDKNELKTEDVKLKSVEKKLDQLSKTVENLKSLSEESDSLFDDAPISLKMNSGKVHTIYPKHFVCSNCANLIPYSEAKIISQGKSTVIYQCTVCGTENPMFKLA
ncbi:MAG: hypothetical protein ACKVOQ_11280 [Cyclobacteriaceae bacterium]